MIETAKLGLPYIDGEQGLKHLTHNEALRILDDIVQLGVVSRSRATPPEDAISGECHIIAEAASGVWAGMANHVASLRDGIWQTYAPIAGWRAWISDEARLVVWNGASWAALNADLESGPLSQLGVNTTADATNRLAVKSDVVLLSHDDVTPGNGDFRAVFNKASAGNTAAVLFQTGWSGRAEFGTTGDDDWHVKVSADGRTWRDALVVDSASGIVRFPSGGVRELLQADRTYYVDADSGDDANDGLGSSTAFATVQKAVDVAAALDTSIHDVTILLSDGTYASGTITLKSAAGAGTISIYGNSTNPENVVLSITGGGRGIAGFGLTTQYRLIGVTLAADVANAYAIDLGESSVLTFGKLRFGGGSSSWRAHFRTQSGAVAQDMGGGLNAYEIAESPDWYHIYCISGGRFSLTYGTTVTLTDTPSWGFAFIKCDSLAYALIVSSTVFSGNATGARYSSVANSLINIQGGSVEFLPGNATGYLATGGQLV